MTTPTPPDDQSALTSPADRPQLRDVDVEGDVRDDLEWRQLLGRGE